MTRICSTPGCPAPYEPEYSEWHQPWCRAIKGHKCFGGPTHAHWPKKGMGGHNPASKIVACLCQGLHDAVDNGFKYGNAVIVDGEGREVYRLWEVTTEPPGKTLIERVIGGSRVVAEDSEVEALVKRSLIENREVFQRMADSDQEPQETPQEAQETALTVVQDWPVTREPHGILKGKALSAPAVIPESYERPGLLTEGPITWEQYCELVANLEAIELNLPFWIGDTIIKGEELFGERAYQPWTERGFGVERIRHYAWVAQQVPPGTRVPSLSFTHHRAVAALPPGEQAEWLERAEAEGMSSRQLRECVTTRRDPCEHTWEQVSRCSKCGKVEK